MAMAAGLNGVAEAQSSMALWTGAELTVAVADGAAKLTVRTGRNGWLGIGIAKDPKNAMNGSHVVIASDTEDDEVQEYVLNSDGSQGYTALDASWTGGVAARAWWKNGVRGLELDGTSIGGEEFNLNGEQTFIVASGWTSDFRQGKHDIAVVVTVRFNDDETEITASPTKEPTILPTEAVVEPKQTTFSMVDGKVSITMTSVPGEEATLMSFAVDRADAGWIFGGVTPGGMKNSKGVLYESEPESFKELEITSKKSSGLEDIDDDSLFSESVAETTDGKLVLSFQVDNSLLTNENKVVVAYGQSGTVKYHSGNKATAAIDFEQELGIGADSVAPTASPTLSATAAPSEAATEPTGVPTISPNVEVTEEPSSAPSVQVTEEPSSAPSVQVTEQPSSAPSRLNTGSPTPGTVGVNQVQTSAVDGAVNLNMETAEGASTTKVSAEVDRSNAGWIAVGVSKGGKMSGSHVLVYENRGGITSRQIGANTENGLFREMKLNSYSKDTFEQVTEDFAFTDAQVTEVDGSLKVSFQVDNKLLVDGNNMVVAYGPEESLSYHGSDKGGIQVDFKGGLGILDESEEPTGAPTESSAAPTISKDQATTAPTASDSSAPEATTLEAMNGQALVTFELLPDGSAVQIALEVKDTRAQWAAIGWSPDGKMQGSRVVVGDNADLVREFRIDSYDSSGVVAQPPSNGISDESMEISDGTLKLQFTASGIAGQDLNLEGKDNLVIAYGSSNGIAYHDNRGDVVVDWQAGVSEEGEASGSTKALMAHGVMMILVFLILMPTAVLASIGRKRLAFLHPEVWWFIHRRVQILAVLTAIVAMIIAIASRSTHFDTPHTKLGLVIVIASVCQPLFAICRNKKRSWWIAQHLFFALFIAICSIIEIWMGLDLGDIFFQDVDFNDNIRLLATIGLVYTLLPIIFGSYFRFQKHCLSPAQVPKASNDPVEDTNHTPEPQGHFPKHYPAGTTSPNNVTGATGATGTTGTTGVDAFESTEPVAQKPTEDKFNLNVI